MLLCFAVVVDAYEYQPVGVLPYLLRILPASDLIDGGIGIFVYLQLYYDGRRVNVFARQEHDVGKSLARRQLAMHHVVVPGIIVGNAEYAGQGFLVVVA